MTNLLLILLLVVGCQEHEDCDGLPGGTASFDDCGLCTGGNTGIIANHLKDCVGVCGGLAVLDECDVCDADDNNNCIQDVCGVWGGEYYGAVDADGDGICDGLDDCVGEYDECGDCNGYGACYCNCNQELDYDLDGICNDDDDSVSSWLLGELGILEVRNGYDDDDDWSGVGYYVDQGDIQCVDQFGIPSSDNIYPCGINHANGTYYLDYEHLEEIVGDSPLQDWSEIFGWDDDKDGDGNLQDFGEWGYVDILCNEDGEECELPNGGFIYTIIQPNQLWNSPNGDPIINPGIYLGPFDQIDGRWLDVGIDEYNTWWGGITDPPIDYNSVTYTTLNDSVYIDWDDIEYLTTMFYDENNNPVYFEDQLQYMIVFDINFDYELCAISNGEDYTSFESNYSINELIENKEYCFYLNAGLTVIETITLSDYIFCFTND